MNTIIRVNMSDLTVTQLPLPEAWAGLGGRGLTSSIVLAEVPPSCDPLGAENVLVFAPGLLGGTSAPNGNRLSVGGKSPLTGGIKEANSGGEAGNALGRLGIAAIIVEGAAADADARYVLDIAATGEASLVARPDLAGLETSPAVEAIAAGRAEDDKYCVVCCGPGGEMRLAAAGIAVTDTKGRPTRFAARGGLGAVMGAKGLKAIVVSYKGIPSRRALDQAAFSAAAKVFGRAQTAHPVAGHVLSALGTGAVHNVCNEVGGYPTRNFSVGQFEGVERISGETQADIIKQRSGENSHGCMTGCVIRCSRYWVDESGAFVTKGPEYESMTMLGANCGIDDIDLIARLDRMCGELGLDTIEIGVALGVFMESGKLAFGDGIGALSTLEEIRTGTELGRILGSGAAATGKAFGVERVPVVKGQGMAAYDPRGVQGIGVTYATSTMGADHTAGLTTTANLFGVGGNVDPSRPDGQVDLSRKLQIWCTSVDALGLCQFAMLAMLDDPGALTAALEMVSAVTGVRMTAEGFEDLGKRVLAVERVFNKRAGFTSEDDRLPAFMTEDPLAPLNVTFGVTDAELDTVFSFEESMAEQLDLAG